MNTAPANRLADKVIGAAWLVSGGILGGLVLAVLTFILHQGVDDTRAAREFLLGLLGGVFWCGAAAMGFLLLLGKHWARICILAAAFGVLAATALKQTPWLTAGVAFVPDVMRAFLPFPNRLVWVLGFFGLITLVALLWPRTVSGPNPDS